MLILKTWVNRVRRPSAFTTVLALLLVLLGCDSTEPDPADVLRVLFVGNSLTSTNNLPGIVSALADANSERPLSYRTVAFPNFSLDDHWNEGSARQALIEESWDYIVMQQGPSSLPENRALLKEWAERFAEEARAHGAEPALLTVWPSVERSFAFPAVIAAYAAAAESVDGLLLPAGKAWQLARQEDGSLQLYGPDGFHPSQLGSYLAALVVYSGLYEASTRGLPASLTLDDGTVVQIPSGTTALLQNAAWDALHTGQD